MFSSLILLLYLAHAPQPGNDLKKLEGNWLMAEMEHGGKKTPAKQLAKMALEVSGNKITTRESGEITEEAVISSMDGKSKPAAFDLKITSGSDSGKVVKGIYKLDGDTLTICVAEPGKDRPEAFAGKVGTGHTLMGFKRKKK
jgi:uncharacterized protein (TIGR03067 family)